MAPNTPSTPQLTAEERLQTAMKAVFDAGKLPNGQYRLSIRKAALIYGVPRTTLGDRLQGKTTRQESHEHQQKQSSEAEGVLIVWLKVCCA